MVKGASRRKPAAAAAARPAPPPTPSTSAAAAPFVHSPAAVPRSLSPSSDSSGIDDDRPPEGSARSGSPEAFELDEEFDPDNTITCQWGECAETFTNLKTLIEHLNEKHVGSHKSTYTCEWTTCPRRGLNQTSRFALISHMRTHTGEKPFICVLPECPKSFTRSDALAKHMRLQHNIEPPAPGRGGSRKRKRGMAGVDEALTVDKHAMRLSRNAAAAAATGSPGMGVLVVDPPGAVGGDDVMNGPDGSAGVGASTGVFRRTGNGRPARRAKGANNAVGAEPSLNIPVMDTQHSMGGIGGPEYGGEEDDGYASTSSDSLPPYLQKLYDEKSGLIKGRTVTKVLYLLMKAKHRYALQENERLLEELKQAKEDVKREKEEKEAALDEFLRRSLGAEEAASLMTLPAPRSLNIPHDLSLNDATPLSQSATDSVAGAINAAYGGASGYFNGPSTNDYRHHSNSQPLHNGNSGPAFKV